MEHLRIENIIEFVSFDTLSEENIKASALVNEHLCECEQCRKVVRAAQLIYDTLLCECAEKETAREKLAETLGEHMRDF